MGKKKSCQELKIPRPLDAVETRLYGWVKEAVLTQPSMIESDSLPEFGRNYPLMEDSGAEGDYVLEAARLSDRVPFRAGIIYLSEDAAPVLRLSEGRDDPLSRRRQPTASEWDVHFRPGGYGYISFRACQGRKLFDSYEDLIQEFKWHYFRFWLLPASVPSDWTMRISLSLGSIGTRSSDAEVGKFLDDLLDVKMKKTKLDDLMARMANPSRMGSRAILPTGSPSATATAAAAAAATSASAAIGPTPVEFFHSSASSFGCF
ncbi:hypothetical protein PIB30_021832 [Stylosanthes scabra]|uniref:Uncharacterized protein n=1 Tax=Stylosanthes scabra TaxID=79078 RepID=A0ABU6Y9C0_9FABA|nr:hypothetical protein [Stylosanthes scabra]